MIEYKSISLASQVYELLANGILRGDYPKGEVLSETRLSKELGVSRTPIREALLRLAQERLVRDSSMGSIVIGLDSNDIRDILDVKRLLEPRIAAGLAENISDKEIEALGEIVDKQEFYSLKGDYEKVMILDTEFHTLMYEASDSIVYGTILSQMHRKLLMVRLASLQDEQRIRASINEHRELFNVLQSRDENAIRNMLELHLSRARENMMRGILDGIDHNGKNN